MNVIVPIFDNSDAAASGNVIGFLKTLKPRNVWLVVNPSVGVTAEDATKEIDTRIANLEQAKNAAAGREDFGAAAQFKQQIEDAKTERDNALRNGWRSAPTAQRDAAYDRTAAPYAELGSVGANVQLTVLADDYAKDNLLGALNALRNEWPRQIPHGEYSLTWPQGVNESAASKIEASRPMFAPEKSAGKPDVSLDTSTREGRKQQLIASRYGGIRAAARKHDITLEGKSMNDLIVEILDKEFPAAA